MVNKFGDISVMLAISASFLLYHSVDFGLVFAITPYLTSHTFFILTYPVNSVSVFAFLLFVGAVGKSAQLGLHT